MWQVIKQLLDDAIRYLPPASPVNVSARAAEDKIVVSVKDSGEGIDEQEQSRVFEKFFRGRGSRFLGPHYRRDATREAAATPRNHNCVHLRQVFEDFSRNRRVARHHVGIVEGMDGQLRPGP